MRPDILHKLCCPFDHGDLELRIVEKNETENRIVRGVLTCSVCQRYYPIVKGIPIMNPDEFREQQLEIPMLQSWGFEITEKGLTGAQTPLKLGE